MDRHDISSNFSDNSINISSDDQYTSSDQDYDLYSAVNGHPMLSFQPATSYQDISALGGQQLFRNNSSVMHVSQSPKSHHNLATLQQIQSSAVSAEHVGDSSTRESLAPPSQSASPLTKKIEEQDSACRPRLTPEQTQFLEEIFSHTPRPSTQQKKRHAVDLGLSHEKVNNWFQNRRAKNKQMTRNRRELILSPSDIHMQQWGNGGNLGYRNSNLSPPLRSSEAELHAIASNSQFGHIHETTTSLDSHGWNSGLINSVAGTYEARNEYESLAHGLSTTLGHGTMEQNNIPQVRSESTFSPGNSTYDLHSDWKVEPSVVTSLENAMPEHDPPVNMNQVMFSLQQSQDMSAQPWQSQHELHSVMGHQADSNATSEQEMDALPVSAVLAQYPAMSGTTSQYVSPQRSPSPTPPIPFKNPFASGELHRRDSTASDLANNVNTFHLQKVSTQGGSDDEVFKTPKIPNLNLAARRKKARPAALMSMRTVSTPAVESPSSNNTAMPSTAVRRIKSTGNSLNVFGARVTKSGASSAQRSPLAQSFRDTGMLEKLSTSSSRFTGSPQCDSTSNSYQSQSNSSPDEPIGTQAWANSPSDYAPPLSASFTQNSYDDSVQSWAVSPPITPLYKPSFFPQFRGGQFQSDVPQSAPAHINAFPSLSPPASGIMGQSNNAHYYQNQVDTAFYAPIPMPLPLAAHSQLLSSNGALDTDFYPQQQPRIMRPGSSSGGAHYGLFNIGAGLGVAPPKPQKELDIVMVSYPTPEARPRSLPRSNGNATFTFQNTGPKDYANIGTVE